MAQVGKTDDLSTYDEVRQQPNIVYAYIRKSDDKVMYVGIDKNGDKDRRKIEHEADSHRAKQKVNNVIQAHPERYYYQVVAVVTDEDWMADIEACLINTFKKVDMCGLNVDSELKEGIDD